MDGSWIAPGESVLRFHGQIEPMCFIMPDTIACCLSHVTGNFRPTFGFRFMTSSRAHVSPGRFAIHLPLPPRGSASFPPGVDDAIGDNDARVLDPRDPTRRLRDIYKFRL